MKRKVLIGTALLLVVPLLFGCGIPQEDYDAAVAEKDAAQTQVASLQSDLTAAQSDLATAQSDLATVQSGLEAAESATASAESQLSSLKSQVATLQRELSEKESTLPPTPVITDDTWTLSSNLYLLTSQGTDSSQTYRQAMGINQFGLLGGSVDYIYQRISIYWNNIRQSNTLILFNATSENLSVLGSWPEQYEEVCPFTVEELNSINLPFALLKRQDNGTIRAIVIANSRSEILQFVVIMKNKQVPVNIPWTLSNEIVASQTGGGWYEEPKVISDANISVQYPEGYETDASNMLAWANQVITELQKWFPDFLDVIGSRIIIEIKDTGDPSHASADVNRPSIIFVAQSVAIQSSSYYDDDYYIGNIAHELSHVMLDRYREMADGYQRSDCPDWFDEGFGEYLKLLVLGEQLFDTKYERYTSEISKIISNGLSGITDVYAGGAWVLRFMDSEFGIDVIKAIITSSQPTFWAAVTEQTNLTQSQFEEQLKEWLNTQTS